MNDSTLRLTPWSQALLATVPGVWVIVQHNVGAHRPLVEEIVITGIAVVISLVSVLASLRLSGRVAPWCLPGFGAVLWKMGDLESEFLGTLRAGSSVVLSWADDLFSDALAQSEILLYFAGGVVIVSAIALSLLTLYWMFRQFRRVRPWAGWILLGAVALDEVLPYMWSLDIFLLMIPVAIGLTWARRDGMKASTFVAACMPFLVVLILSPLGPLSKVTQARGYDRHYITTAEQTMRLLYQLPFVCFFIVVPVGILLSRSTTAQAIYLLLPSLATLVVMHLLGGLALRRTEWEYLQIDWLRQSLNVVKLYVPLLVSATLYISARRSSGGEALQGTEGDALPFRPHSTR